MKKIITLMLLSISLQVSAKNLIKVAVIDTGFNFAYASEAHLCKTGHKDFTGEGLQDTHGHGTNIVGLIAKHAKSDGYCVIIIKAFGFIDKEKEYLIPALRYARDLDVNIINLSGGGLKPIESERLIVEQILKQKKLLIAAAGNNYLNLDKNCNYYPACYDPRIYVVGDYNVYSNYGKVVDIYYNGKDQMAFGQVKSGTSQSTAIFTGELLNTIAIKQKGW